MTGPKKSSTINPIITIQNEAEENHSQTASSPENLFWTKDWLKHKFWRPRNQNFENVGTFYEKMDFLRKFMILGYIIISVRVK